MSIDQKFTDYVNTLGNIPMDHTLGDRRFKLRPNPQDWIPLYDFVIDPMEFESEFSLHHRVSPVLTRPLMMYRGLAIGAVQGTLTDRRYLSILESKGTRKALDYLSAGVAEMVYKTAHIVPGDREMVIEYVTELIHYLTGIILQRIPALGTYPGRYDVTISPGPEIPGTLHCLVFTVHLKYNPTRYPHKKLTSEWWEKKDP